MTRQADGVTPSRDSGRQRPKGYAAWAPKPATRALVETVWSVLDEYGDHLPLTVRQIFYRLVGEYGYEKSERAYERLREALVRARRAEVIPFDHIRDDGIVVSSERWYLGQQDFLEEFARQARRYRRDRQQGQRVRVELWSESAGMLPQLAAVAHEFSAAQ